MDWLEIFKFIMQFAVLPIATITYWFVKKQDNRIDNLEQRANHMENTIAKIETELRYISRDIAEIKTLISKLADR